jgi:hypothetical protein
MEAKKQSFQKDKGMKIPNLKEFLKYVEKLRKNFYL